MYKGELPSSGDTLRVKHAVRKKLHPQLAELWKKEPALLSVSESKYSIEGMVQVTGTGKGLREIAGKFQVGSFNFMPLITSHLNLVCHLDILFLRREAPGSLLKKGEDKYGGDLDNRLKILFDSLRVPHNTNELPPGEAPQSDENPFYCLLEDDALITKFQVESDRLLLTPTTGKDTDVELIIRVSTRITKLTIENMAFGST